MNLIKYNHVTTLEEAKQIIAEQDMIIGKQYREILQLEETQRRHNQCTSQRKKEAGYDQSISFDIVWEETLKKAQSY
jgi:hypothetical protein